jgi:transcription elongation GreA/GreB family factor
MPSEIEKARKALEAAKGKRLAEVSAKLRDIERLGDAREALAAAVRAARADGISWRELADATGRKAEFIRSVSRWKD